jgi:hypothetical protein
MKIPVIDRWKKYLLISIVSFVLVIKTVLFFVSSNSGHTIVPRAPGYSDGGTDEEALANFDILQVNRNNLNPY